MPKAGGKQEMCLGALGETVEGYKVSFWGDGNVLELDTADGCINLWIYQNTLSGTF